MTMRRRSLALKGLLMAGLLVMALPASAGALLIWPIHPVIENGRSATALWLENRGSEPTLIQLRIFEWQQREGKDQYQSQDDLVGSPPMMEIAPGQQQLVRLIRRTTPPPSGEEQAWRVILDEVPTSSASDGPAGQTRAGVELQMRYSLPLFDYGEGAAPEDGAEASEVASMLGWRIIRENGRRYLEVRNRGERHARLTEVAFGQGATVTKGLLGYVLADSYRRWPLEETTPGDTLFARVNGGETVRLARWSPAP